MRAPWSTTPRFSPGNSGGPLFGRLRHRGRRLTRCPQGRAGPSHSLGRGHPFLRRAEFAIFWSATPALSASPAAGSGAAADHRHGRHLAVVAVAVASSAVLSGGPRRSVICSGRIPPAARGCNRGVGRAQMGSAQIAAALSLQRLGGHSPGRSVGRRPWAAGGSARSRSRRIRSPRPARLEVARPGPACAVSDLHSSTARC